MKLFPMIKPYRHGYLNVGDGHRLYYEMCGNPKGKPVVYLHGGPGGGCSEHSRRFFNPKVWNIILFDQRGSGRSKPFGSTKANTTAKLVEDIRKLLQFLRMEKAFLFGGSWGSTLALVYAIKYPKTVSGMLLRGVFLSRDRDVRGTYDDGGLYFPDALERLKSLVPQSCRQDTKKMMAYYLGKMKSKDIRIAEKYAFEWAYYEMSMIKLGSTKKEVLKTFKDFNYLSLAIMETHFLKSNCFLPENYILKNAHRLKMPVSIVQGRYDTICAPVQAWLLHKALPQSRLSFVTAAHGSMDPKIEEKLLEEMKLMGKYV